MQWAVSSNIADKILEKKADCVLARKGNQGALREDVEAFAAEQKASGLEHSKVGRQAMVAGDHGRAETVAGAPRLARDDAASSPDVRAGAPAFSLFGSANS